MYDLIFEFIRDNLFSSQYLTNYNYQWFGVNTPINVILSHITSIALITTFVIILCLFVRWLFKLVSGLFLLR